MVIVFNPPQVKYLVSQNLNYQKKNKVLHLMMYLKNKVLKIKKKLNPINKISKIFHKIRKFLAINNH